jgi:hypothetical protein
MVENFMDKYGEHHEDPHGGYKGEAGEDGGYDQN